MRWSGKRYRLSIVALAFCALAVSGCAFLGIPRIDPTGEHVFAEPPVAAAPPLATVPPYYAQPGSPLLDDDVEVMLSPQVTVAPVGGEVVLVAGVRGGDGYLRTNRRLEWSIAPGGVGQFVAVANAGPVDLLLGDLSVPRKVNNTFAVGTTLRQYQQLDRGTATTEDDVYVLRGQGWITLNSPVEGTSHVMVFAPDVRGWDCRTRTATVHWVDAQWRFPPPAINPAGTSHVLTTTVIRQSDQMPRPGWRVRYEIVDGPPAGFAPDGVAVVEVPTDAAGQANAEVFQKEPGPGTNRICIQIVRPPAVNDSQSEQLVVASGSTLETWTAPALALRMTGPSVAGAGATLTYNIQVSNPGDMPANDALLTDQLPEGLSYLASNPAAEVSGQTVRWQLGPLGPGETRTVRLDARATRTGSITNCADVVAAGGLKASHCATATVTGASVNVSVTGPSQAVVGNQVTFEIVVTNNSQAPATGLLVKDSFDTGLEHALAEQQNTAIRKIESDLADLAPGQSQRLSVTFRVARAGRLCHTVEVTGENGVRASGQGCVNAAAATSMELRPPAQQRPSISLSKSILDESNLPVKDDAALPSRNAGDTVRFALELSNTGSRELTNLTLVDRYDPSLMPVNASDGYRLDGDNLVWTIDSLPAGRPLRLEVECRCLSAVARACNRATLTAEEGVQAEDDACLEIRAAPGGLAITVHDFSDPVALGKGTTYEIRVSNQGQTAHRDLSVVATVPVGMLPDRIGTSGPGMPTIEGQTVRFDPVAELPAGETATYRVRVRTRQAGKYSLRAEVTSRDQPQPVAAEETTEVVQ